MTLRELLIRILEEYKDENLLDKELAYFVKDNPDETFDPLSIQSIEISEEYILLTHIYVQNVVIN